MADFLVTTGDDSVAPGEPTSLREAITAANASPGADTITFATGVTTVTLDDALPAIVDDLTIQGGGTVTIDANADGDADPDTALGTAGPDFEARRVLDVGAGVALTLDGLTVTGGVTSDGTSGDASYTRDYGGGIRAAKYAGSMLELIDVVVRDNIAEASAFDNMIGSSRLRKKGLA